MQTINNHWTGRASRHVAGMMILALANPYIRYGNDPVATWVSTWAVPLLIGLAAYGLYALLFRARAKAGWPGKFLMIAWVLLVLVIAAPYLEAFNNRTSRPVAGRAEDWERGAMTPPPAQQPAEGVPAQATGDEWWKKGATRIN